jgi:hypothetical protein
VISRELLVAFDIFEVEPHSTRRLAELDLDSSRDGVLKHCSRLRVDATEGRLRNVQEPVMRRKIVAAMMALTLLSPATVSFAQSSNTTGPVNPNAEGIGNTSSTHNPRQSAPDQTGMEKRKATGSEMGTDSSTHNPTKENR